MGVSASRSARNGEGSLGRRDRRVQVIRAALHAELAQAFEAGEFVDAIVGSGHTNQQISKSANQRLFLAVR